MSNKYYDKKVFRMMHVLNCLDKGRQVVTRELAKEFNVSLRTIQRDIGLLQLTGFPIESAEKGSYVFSEGFTLKQMTLSHEEASLMAVLYEMMHSLGSNFEVSFRAMLKKLVSDANSSPYYVKMPEGMKLEKTMPFMEDLRLAVEEGKRIKIFYENQEKRRWYDLEPLKIIYYDGFWYLMCCKKKVKQVIKFRLDRIKKLEVLEEYFTAPMNVKTILDQSVNAWFAAERDTTVVLRIEHEVADFFRKKTYFPLQKIKKEYANGNIDVQTLIAREEEVIPIILQWMPYIRVLRPKALAEAVRDRVKSYLNIIK